MPSSLINGARVGPYEILAPLGAGGMGEVYRARDERLKRVVAVKVLSKEFLSDPDRLRRFEQEARNLAALNHSNILIIYDTGVQDGTPYLVSELLDGRTLREELNAGPLPVRKVMDYARQISRGIAAAHGVGIVHRDLKPENLFIAKDGTVKLLDFGLAKAHAAIPGTKGSSAVATDETRALENSPTIVQTEPGLVMGTPGYMSPEQVRGADADPRSDLFALGATLYEMLTGQRAFRRETSVQTMNAILTEDPPDLTERIPNLPPSLDRVVRRCLEKEPSQRFQSASDLAFALDNISPSGGTVVIAPPPALRARFRPSQLIPWAIGVTALGTAVVFFVSSRPRPVTPTREEAPLRKFELHIPRPVRTGQGAAITDLVISPDGNKLAYLNADGLWVRWLDRLGPAVLLNGSDKVRAPFWSPRGDELAYFEGNRLFRVTISGGKPIPICRTGKDLSSGAWLSNDSIFFASREDDRFTNALYRVSANGGDPKVALPDAPPELTVHQLTALPHGRGILAVLGPRRMGESLAIFDGVHPFKPVLQVPGSHLSRACYSPSGHILYERKGENRGLWALAFSLDKLEAVGEPFRVSEEAVLASVAEDGTLAYRPAPGTSLVKRQLVWVDRSGQIAGTIGAPQPGLRSPKLSPDDRRIAAVCVDAVASSSVWLFAAAGGQGMPLTQSDAFDTAPYWFNDGQRLLFTRTGSGAIHTLVKRVDNLTPPQELFRAGVLDVARNGQTVLLGIAGAPIPPRLATLQGPRKQPIPLPQEFTKTSCLKLSPDASLLAYVSEEAERPEVYLIAVPSFTNKTLVSRGGSRQVEWSPTGSELFYVSLDGRTVMSVAIKRADPLELSEPTKLFDLPEPVRSGELVRNAFDVSSDGQRFVMIRNVRDETNAPVALPASAIVVLNWFQEFRSKAVMGLR